MRIAALQAGELYPSAENEPVVDQRGIGCAGLERVSIAGISVVESLPIEDGVLGVLDQAAFERVPVIGQQGDDHVRHVVEQAVGILPVVIDDIDGIDVIGGLGAGQRILIDRYVKITDEVEMDGDGLFRLGGVTAAAVATRPAVPKRRAPSRATAAKGEK